MSPAARLADAMIRAYQVRLSPRKGWSCAYLVANGGQSCSAAVRSIVRTRGMIRGVVPAWMQFLACYRAAGLLMAGDVQGVCCCGGIPIPFKF